jgi:radical SAM superfamily enzyme YgiQ (UPF0313 family)
MNYKPNINIDESITYQINDRWFQYSKFIGSRKNKYNNELVNFVLCSISAPEYYPFNLGSNIIDKVVNDSKYFCGRAIYRQYSQTREFVTNKLINEFDVIGISAYMIFQLISIPRFLYDNKIQPLNKFREEDDPIILLGGQSFSFINIYNNFVDAACIGEGEELIIEMLNVLQYCKDNNYKRIDIINELANIDGLYVPILHKYNKTIKKRYIKKENLHLSLLNNEHIQSKLNRKVIELARGCKYMCNFCSLSRNNFPYRQNSPNNIMKCILTFPQDSQIYPFAPDEGSYKHNEEVSEFTRLNGYQLYRYNFRMDTVTDENIQRNNMSKRIVFGIDAISQRVCNIVDKRIDFNIVKDKISKIFDNDYKELKLNYVFNYPFENDNDYKEFKEFLHYIVNANVDKKTMVVLAPTPFIPEINTPMFYFRLNRNWDKRFENTVMVLLIIILIKGLPQC